LLIEIANSFLRISYFFYNFDIYGNELITIKQFHNESTNETYDDLMIYDISLP